MVTLYFLEGRLLSSRASESSLFLVFRPTSIQERVNGTLFFVDAGAPATFLVVFLLPIMRDNCCHHYYRLRIQRILLRVFCLDKLWFSEVYVHYIKVRLF